MRKYDKKKPSSGWKRKALTGLCVVLALVLALMAAGTVYYESLLNKINRPGNEETVSLDEMDQILQEDVEQATGDVVDDDKVVIDTADEIQVGEDVINIMLVGQDARPGEKRARSDTMILCTVRKSDNTVILTSFLRDTYVNIPGYAKAKLNVAYRVGGMKKLSETMLQNFGIRIDNTVEVDFSGFQQVVDAMGGVDIELTDAEAYHLNGVYGWKLKPGVRHLTGEQALGYARIRYLDNDFRRTERQRNVINALLQSIKGASLGEINALINQLMGVITTDMTNAEITGYVLDCFPMLANLQIVNQRIPLNDTYHYANISGAGSCVVIDFDTNIAFLQETLGG